jgi:hypothetical protein
MIEELLPVGRIVSGHPMVGNVVKDNITNLPKMQKDGTTPQMSYYVGYAIQKGAETDWKQTVWGQKIVAQAAADWPNGEHGAPTFAWKVTDGDSMVPNKKGKKPAEREGWPGHWVVQISQGWPYPCYHSGHFQPHEVIQQKEQIKAGDYARFVITIKGNGPSESPGMYLNPVQMELVQAGIKIITESIPDANAAFGGAAAVMPTGAAIDTSVAAPAPVATTAAPAPQPGAAAPAPQPGAAAPAPQTVAPAPEVLTPVVVSRNVNGQVCTEAALLAANWTPEAIAALPLA